MEQESSVLQELHNTNFKMELDQKKYDLLLSISDLIDETLSDPINTSDIELPSDVITKGCLRIQRMHIYYQNSRLKKLKIIKKLEIKRLSVN